MNKAVRSLAAAVSIAAVSVASLSGCANSPTTAATVDGVIISERSVAQGAAALETALGASHSESVPTAVTLLVRREIIDRLAKDNGVALTDAQREQAIAAEPKIAALAAEPGGKELAFAMFDTATVVNSLNSDVIATQLPQHTVVLNPRYGTWNVLNVQIEGSGSLSTPIEELAQK